MIENVFIFGAGASQDTGAPLMNEFLDRTEDLSREFDPEIRSAVDRVLDARQYLRDCRSYVSLELLNVETVFSAIETAILLGRLGPFDPKTLLSLPHDIRNVIIHTLVRSIPFKVKRGTLVLDSAYMTFVREVIKKRQQVSSGGVAVITLNYDVALEWAVHSNRLNFDYCLDGHLRSDRVNILKLHGSLNWFRCHSQECGQICALEMSERVSRIELDDLEEEEKIHLGFAPMEHDLRHCGRAVPNDPVIVPPTWAKLGYQREIKQIWSAAATALSNARNVVVVGYSLPLSDPFFQHLLAIGLKEDRRLRHFNVIDCDKSNEVQKKYEMALGPTATERFRYYRSTFDSALSDGNMENMFCPSP